MTFLQKPESSQYAGNAVTFHNSLLGFNVFVFGREGSHGTQEVGFMVTFPERTNNNEKETGGLVETVHEKTLQFDEAQVTNRMDGIEKGS